MSEKEIEEITARVMEKMGEKYILVPKTFEEGLTELTKRRQTYILSVAQLVCDEMSLSVNDLLSGTRLRTLSDARKIVSYLCHFNDNGAALTASLIGKTLKRDHATILYNIKMATSLIESNFEFRTIVLKVKQSLNQINYNGK